MKTFEVCVLKSFDDFGSFAADGFTVKLACRHTKSARGRNYYFVGVFKLFESIVAFFYRYAFSWQISIRCFLVIPGKTRQSS